MRRWPINQACRAVQAGGIIAYPTEAIYGLGCDPENMDAVLDLCDLKQRPIDKGLILIASQLSQLEPYIAPTTTQLRKATATWPGPFTWILPASEFAPPWITGSHTGIAVRVTAHPLAAALCDRLGHALVSTSANISNRPPARSAFQVRRIFDQQLDFILHGPTGKLAKPTRIQDAHTNKPLRNA